MSPLGIPAGFFSCEVRSVSVLIIVVKVMAFRKTSTVFLAGSLGLLVLAAGFCLFTETGSSFLVKEWLLHSSLVSSLKVEAARGNLVQGLWWKGVVAEAPGTLPKGFAFRAEEIVLSQVFFLRRNVSFHEAGLGFPGNPSALSLNGVCSANHCDLAIKTNHIKVGDLVTLLTQERFQLFTQKFIRPLKLISTGQVSAQNINVSFTRSQKPELKVSIFNGRLETPESDTILFGGEYKNGAFDLNVYTNAVSVPQVVLFFPAKVKQWKLSGTALDVDLKVSGKFRDLEIAGKLTIEKLAREGRSVNNAHCELRLRTVIKEAPELHGVVEIKDGTVSGPNTADIHLEPSRIVFKGDAAKAVLDLKGKAEVAKTRIDIGLKGTFAKPELKVESYPQLPQEQLLVMLLTNRGWSGTEASLEQGKVSLDAANEFVDYFLLGSRGRDVLKALGIKDVSVTVEKTRQGVGLTKEVTNNLDANYAYEQTLDAATGLSSSVQRIGGDLKLNDSFSVEAEREIRLRGALQNSTETQPPTDKILLKYRRTF